MQRYFSDIKRPFIISGPCSVESPEQVQDTVNLLAQSGRVHMIRGGIWKPRTFPGSFEGFGEKALNWLKDACITVNLPFTVEVATSEHVELALKYGASALWIGARTTVNPFMVQEIAEVLRGTNIAVLVKNPVNPELGLWQGAIERIAKVGISDIAAIHRGFTAYAESTYRNDPRWEIVIEFMRRLPDVPVICDPSHISGKREYIAAIAQKAMDLNMSGLMVETHINPDKALSDSLQQLTPNHFIQLIDDLIIRDIEPSDLHLQQSLAFLRSQADELDDELVNLLQRRLALSDKMGILKKKNNVTVFQPDRYNEIQQRLNELAQKLKISPEMVRDVFERIHTESIARQSAQYHENLSLPKASAPNSSSALNKE
jgi:chorismate mutase